MEKKFCALVAALLAVAACDSNVPAKAPETPAKPLVGQAAAGPFPSVEAWCKTLKATDCQQRDDIVTHVTMDPVTTRSGVKVEAIAAAWRDESLQRGVVLLKRGSDLFALPAAVEYDPNDGKKHSAILMPLRHFEDEDSNLIHVVYEIAHPTPGASRADMSDYRELHDLCTVEAGKSIRCNRIVTGVRRDFPNSEKGEWSAATTLPMIKGLTLEILVVVPDGPEGKALEPEILAPGKYTLQFP